MYSKSPRTPLIFMNRVYRKRLFRENCASQPTKTLAMVLGVVVITKVKTRDRIS